MSELPAKCETCRALIDEEDLFCANCGAEAPQAPDAVRVPSPDTIVSKHNFSCNACGASMSYDAGAQTLRCPFCGSERLEAQRDAKVLAPQGVVPFQIPHDQAVLTMRGWLGRGFWRPGDLASAASIDKTAAVYVPYWVFQVHTFTYWTADSDRTPLGARGDWVPLTGEHRGHYQGVLVGASGALTPAETGRLCPFDLTAAQKPEEVDLEQSVVEQFRVQRKYARPLARQSLQQLELDACRGYVPGRARNLKVNMRLEGLQSTPMLLPVWILSYRYRERVYRFLINGQSGQATGEAPWSWKKLVVALLLAAGLLAGLLFLLAQSR